MPLDGAEIPIDFPEKADPETEHKPKGKELLLRQVDRLSELIQKEYDSQEPHFPEEEEEFQKYLYGWVAEYQRLSSAGPDHQEEALEVLGMIRALLGDLPIEEKLLQEGIYDLLPVEGSLPEEA